MNQDTFSTLPKDAIEELEQKLEKRLKKIYSHLGPGQAFIQFIGDIKSSKNSIPLQPPPEKLWIRNEGLKVQVLPSETPGLTGWAAINNKLIIYPTDPESKKHYAEADPRVNTEIVGPIHYNRRVTGVVLFDCMQENRIYEKAERDILRKFLHEIDQEIHNIEWHSKEQPAGIQLTSIVNNCYIETISVRGYIAVKRWDGLLEYFTVGHEKEVFLELSPHEGLCGKVFRTGKYENLKDLLKDGNYIPSDNGIKSEIVYPIKLRGETIGVINLESYLPDAYNETTIELLEKWSEVAASHAEIYRTPPDSNFGFAIADLYQTSLWIRPDESQEKHEEDIRATLERWANGLLGGKKCEFWMSKHHPSPNLLRGKSWDEAVKGDTISASSNSVLYAPVLLQGDPIFIIAIELKNESRSQDLQTLKALCRIASEVFRRATYEYRMRRFINLVVFLSSQGHNEAAIDQAVQEIPFILQSNHCTLFYPLEYNERAIFVPGPSTAEEIHVKGHHPGYLPKAKEGLTGFVAETGKPLRIRNVRDASELSTLYQNLIWQSRISEEIELECRSLLAFPVFNSDLTKVIGVLRTHRDSNSRKSGFTNEDEHMFEVIAHLLSKPILAFLKKSNPLE